LETSYLEETRDFGNVFTGWDSYLAAEKTKVKKSIHYEDRHFSLSSVTSPASRKEESKKVRCFPSLILYRLTDRFPQSKPENSKKKKKEKDDSTDDKQMKIDDNEGEMNE
jgi:hypothetical protein